MRLLFAGFVLLFLLLTVEVGLGQVLDTAQLDTVEYVMGDTVRARELLEEGMRFFNETQYDIALEKITRSRKIFTQVLEKENIKSAACLHAEGRVWYGKKEYTKAINSWEEALKVREKILGPENLEAATTSNNLGLAYTMLRDFKSGYSYFEKALTIRKGELGENHYLVARSLNDIGWLFIRQGNYYEAIEHLNEALSIFQDAQVEPSKLLGLIHFNLGKCFEKTEKHDKGLQHFKQSLTIRKQFFPINHLNIAYSYHNVAYMLTQKGDFDNALIYYDSAKRAYSSLEDVVNEVTIDNNIGDILNKKGAYSEALVIHKEVLEKRKKILGPTHQSIAQSYDNIALSLINLDSFQAGIKYSQMALNLSTELFGQNSLQVGEALQNLGFYHWKNGEFDQALEFNHRAMDLKEALLAPDNSSIGWTHHNLGEVYESLGDYELSIFHYNKSLVIFQSNYGKDHLDVGHIHYHLGWNYYLKGDLKKAHSETLKALNIHQLVLSNDNLEIGRILNNIGVISLNLGKTELAAEYFQKALNIAQHAVGARNSLTGIFLMNAGIAFKKVGNYTEAQRSLQKAEEIYQTVWGKQHRETALVYLNLSSVFFNLSEFETAIEYAEKALQIYSNSNYANYKHQAHTYQILGQIYLEKGQLDKALPNLQDALSTYQNAHGNIHYETAESFYYLGLFHIQANNQIKARKHLQDALFSLNYLGPKHLANISSVPLLVKILIAKAELRLNQINQNFNFNSVQYLTSLYDELLEIIEFLIHSKDMNKNLMSDIDVSSAYEGAIEVNLKSIQMIKSLRHINKICQLMEHSKSLLLYQSMQEANALNFAGIPDSLLQKEYDLRVDITYYDKKRQEKLNEGFADTDTSVLSISSKLFDLTQAYDQLKTQFEKDYPEYYRLKYDLNTISVTEVQDSLLYPNQALLEYFVGDSSLFIFVVTKDDYQVHQIKRDFPLQQWIEQLKDNIRQPHAFSLEAYAEAAHQLYQKLVLPVAHLLPERLIIVPDGILGYVPFEALLTEKPKNIYSAARFPYLLRQKQISYSYSATLLREMQQKQHRQPPTREVLAMAPFATTDTVFTSHLIHQDDWLAGLRSDTLAPLPYTQLELDSLVNRFEVDAFYGGQATEKQFTDYAGQYRIVHLATHGKADARIGDYSYLAFAPLPDSLENELLYVRDLYNLQLNADLVVLSACETGTGELQRGEGIISLARAFAYAGAKSIATTLWQVNDQSMQELIVDFYRYLDLGFAKDMALRQAKLDYLNRHPDSKAHPSHWAAVIGVGDMRALK